MSEIQKQLASALQHLQQVSDKRYSDLQTQLNDLSEQLIQIADGITKDSSNSTGGRMRKSTDETSPCASCKHGMYYTIEGATAPKFQCLISGIERSVSACNQHQSSETI